MKKTIPILMAVLLVGLLAFCFQPDPSAEWHQFQDTMSNLDTGSGFRLVSSATESFADIDVEKNIPLSIRHHPRRIFSKAWQVDFVGLSCGQHAFVFADGRDRIVCHVYSVRQRTCAVDVVHSTGQLDAATTLADAIRSNHTRMHIRIREHNKASEVTVANAPEPQG